MLYYLFAIDYAEKTVSYQGMGRMDFPPDSEAHFIGFGIRLNKQHNLDFLYVPVERPIGHDLQAPA